MPEQPRHRRAHVRHLGRPVHDDHDVGRALDEGAEPRLVPEQGLPGLALGRDVLDDPLEIERLPLRVSDHAGVDPDVADAAARAPPAGLEAADGPGAPDEGSEPVAFGRVVVERVRVQLRRRLGALGAEHPGHGEVGEQDPAVRGGPVHPHGDVVEQGAVAGLGSLEGRVEPRALTLRRAQGHVRVADVEDAR